MRCIRKCLGYFTIPDDEWLKAGVLRLERRFASTLNVYRFWLPAILGLLWASAIPAQNGTGAIAGVVMSGGSNEPVKKVVVRLEWSGPPKSFALARTGADGRFRFDSLPPGRYKVSGRLPGGNLAASFQLVLHSGEMRGNVVLRPLEGASISGRVLDGDGDPIPDATVDVYRATWRRGRIQLHHAGMARASLRGEFRLSGLVPGRYWASATGGDAYRPGTPLDGSIYPRMYFGGVPEWSRATPIPLAAGQSVDDVDIRLAASKMRIWTARLTGLAEGGAAPERTVALRITPLDPPGNTSRFESGRHVGPDGVLRSRMAPGVYAVEVTAEFGEPAVWAIERVDLTQDSAESTIALAPPFELPGRVRVVGAGANPVEGPMIQLRPVLNPGEARSARAQPGGRFTVRGLMATAYDVSIEPLPPGGYVESVKLGETDARSGFELSSGNKEPLEIVINRGGGTVEAAVSDDAGEPVEARVLLAPADPAMRAMSDRYREERAGVRGEVRFTGVPPGRYMLMALVAESSVDGQDPSLFDTAGRYASVVEVAASGKVKADLHLVPDAQVEASR